MSFVIIKSKEDIDNLKKDYDGLKYDGYNQLDVEYPDSYPCIGFISYDSKSSYNGPETYDLNLEELEELGLILEED